MKQRSVVFIILALLVTSFSLSSIGFANDASDDEVEVIVEDSRSRLEELQEYSNAAEKEFLSKIINRVEKAPSVFFEDGDVENGRAEKFKVDLKEVINGISKRRTFSSDSKEDPEEKYMNLRKHNILLEIRDLPVVCDLFSKLADECIN